MVLTKPIHVLPMIVVSSLHMVYMAHFFLVQGVILSLTSSHGMHYNVLKSLFVAMQLIPNGMVIIAYSIATFSNCMLN